jgi:hypothetical protein
MSKDRSARSVLARVFASSLLARQAYAGNEANFVLYDHHNEPSYSAQLFEIERALTDRWEAALYLEGDKVNGDDYKFGGWRYRLFE